MDLDKWEIISPCAFSKDLETYLEVKSKSKNVKENLFSEKKISAGLYEMANQELVDILLQSHLKE